MSVQAFMRAYGSYRELAARSPWVTDPNRWVRGHFWPVDDMRSAMAAPIPRADLYRGLCGDKR